MDDKFNKLKELVKSELETDPRTRDSDKFLIWKIMIANGIHIHYDKFMALPCFESITRARRKIQEQNPELEGNANIKVNRNEKMNMYKETSKPQEITNTF